MHNEKHKGTNLFIQKIIYDLKINAYAYCK